MVLRTFSLKAGDVRSVRNVVMIRNTFPMCSRPVLTPQARHCKGSHRPVLQRAVGIVTLRDN